MKNIIMSIILYSKQIPFAEEKSIECDYVVFGSYDGVSLNADKYEIGDFEKNMNLKAKGFSELWNQTKQEIDKMNGTYNFSTLFGIRTEEEEAAMTQEEFDSINDKPFLFITMLQFKEYNIDYQKLRKDIERKLNKESAFNKDVAGICYQTIDDMDLILMLKTNSYKKGISIINDFHREENQDYLSLNCGTTVFGFSNDVLNKPETVFDHFDEEIDMVNFYAIEQKMNGTVKVQEAIVSELKKVWGNKIGSEVGERLEIINILGNNDKIMNWKGANWKYLLPLYRMDTTGALMNENIIFKENIYSVSTEIISKIDDGREFVVKITEKYNGKKSNEGDKGFYDYYKNKLEENKEKEKNEKEEKKELINIYIKSFQQILNTLKKFETTGFSKYVYASIILQVERLFNLIEKKGENYTETDKHAVFEFLNSLSILIHNASGTDREFFQSPDFNLKMYEFPAKMQIFYASYIRKLVNFMEGLNSEDSKKYYYNFLICPWIVDKSNSKIIFENDEPKDRLLLIRVPEDFLYNTEDAMLVFAHEVAHFVGDEVRNRRKRYNTIIDVTFYSMIENLVTEGILENISKEEKKELYGKFRKYFEVAKTDYYKTDYYKTDYYKTGTDKQYPIYEERYFEYIRHMRRCLPNILATSFGLLEQNIIFLAERELYKDSGDDELLLEKQKKIISLKKKLNDLEKKQHLKSIFDQIIYMLSETFADLLQILCLRLKPKSYISALVTSAANLQKDKIAETELAIRISFVCWVMLEGNERKGEQDFYKQWSKEEWGNFVNDCKELTPEKEMANSVSNILLNILEGKCEYIIDANEKEPEYEIYKHLKTWRLIREYLIECKKHFLKSMEDDDLQKKQKKLADLYIQINENSMEERLKYMNKSICEYMSSYYESFHFKKPGEGEHSV